MQQATNFTIDFIQNHISNEHKCDFCGVNTNSIFAQLVEEDNIIKLKFMCSTCIDTILDISKLESLGDFDGA